MTTTASSVPIVQEILHRTRQKPMDMNAHVPTIKPEVLVERQTPKLRGVGIDAQLVICGAVARGVAEAVLGRVVEDGGQVGVCIEQQRRGGGVLRVEGCRMRGEGLVPLRDHGRVGPRVAGSRVTGPAVQGRQRQEQEALVAGVVDGLDGVAEPDCRQVVVKGRERGDDGRVVCAVANVVDADPEDDERVAVL